MTSPRLARPTHVAAAQRDWVRHLTLHERIRAVLASRGQALISGPYRDNPRALRRWYMLGREIV